MKKVNECLAVNGKKWFMAVVCALVMAATVCGCGSSSDGTGVDDGNEDEDVPTYVPVESKLVAAMATYPIAGMQYDKWSFAMFSEAKLTIGRYTWVWITTQDTANGRAAIS